MQMKARYLARLSKYCTILFQPKTTLRVKQSSPESQTHVHSVFQEHVAFLTHVWFWNSPGTWTSEGQPSFGPSCPPHGTGVMSPVARSPALNFLDLLQLPGTQEFPLAPSPFC